MPNSHVYQPAGWKHIRSAYASVTRKLNSNEDKGNKAMRIEDALYVLKRITEDLESIQNDADALDPPTDEAP